MTMNITESIATFPEYAKDIRLNYSKVLNENTLNKQQLYGIILISSLTTQNNHLIELALEEIKNYLDKNYIEDVYGAFAIMTMNSIYYRFTHLSTEYDYSSIPANLRMQYLTKHKIEKQDFEALCLAVAVLLGCGKCINAHEATLRVGGMSTQSIQSVARVAAIINAIANLLKVRK